MNPVSVGKDLPVDGDPGYPGAVPASQIFQDQGPVFPADNGVDPGHIRLFDPEVTIIVPTDDNHVVPNPEPLLVIPPDQYSKIRFLISKPPVRSIVFFHKHKSISQWFKRLSLPVTKGLILDPTCESGFRLEFTPLLSRGRNDDKKNRPIHRVVTPAKAGVQVQSVDRQTNLFHADHVSPIGLTLGYDCTGSMNSIPSPNWGGRAGEGPAGIADKLSWLFFCFQHVS